MNRTATTASPATIVAALASAEAATTQAEVEAARAHLYAAEAAGVVVTVDEWCRLGRAQDAFLYRVGAFDSEGYAR